MCSATSCNIDLGIFLHTLEIDLGIFLHFCETDLGFFDFLRIFAPEFKYVTVVYLVPFL